MKKLIFFCTFLLLFIENINAHNPLSAVYYLEVKENIGILNINLSQAGLQAALSKDANDIEINNLTDTEYKNLAVKYIKEHFYLNIDGLDVSLLEGGMKLGNHQTNFKFITSKLPKEFEKINIKIDAFKENDSHQTIFSLLLNKSTSKVILSKKNNYNMVLGFDDNNKMIAKDNNYNFQYFWFLLIIPFFVGANKIFKKNK